MLNVCLRRRITWLVGVYALLAAAPILATLMPLNTMTLPILWATYVPAIGAIMLLAFWAGMGDVPIAWRLAALLGGCAYLAIWPTLADSLLFWDEWEPVAQYLQGITAYTLVAFLVFGMFAIMQLRFQMSDDVVANGTKIGNRFQFSVVHLLVLTSLAAVVLSLMRGARGSEAADVGIESWQWWASHALVIVTFFANTACAAWAALGPHSVVRNCSLVLLVSALLGVAVAFSVRQDQVGWYFFSAGVLMLVLPTAAVLASLLFLRPSGIRLIRRGEVTQRPSAAQSR